ncbi:hypothetical protein SAMD00019534_107710 [Acytostelium subglobosum LB1]|uniref:hypothetical protein n=1 Tax=Acytostelium subglobosum LB1 TaxID=1410327 RepID=UPI0006449AD7|nr:hypothetical protein SAMD00019534_107710 [Acytostelium subglobosum LB1]GAM27595.1 hypothetical protein SAMD00019534_107710 [Acytostelium subglobosum LB1]|eukprot:XP_012749254.1 hypothetical protein SAMD00019534_107710 [Acytostelium subglobosum LB1]
MFQTNKYIISCLLLTIVVIAQTADAMRGQHHTTVNINVEEDDMLGTTFTSGNMLFTNPMGVNPNQILEFTTDGVSVQNYTTFLQNDTTKRCLPYDIAFLNPSILLLMDPQQGIFYSSQKGNVKGIWANLATNSGHIGCDLQALTVDQVNKRVYVSSTNIKCDTSHIPGVFVYDLTGTYIQTLTNPAFNNVWDVAADSTGTIWVTDNDNIFLFHPDGTKEAIDPVDNKLGYSGIQVTPDDTILVSVPAPGNDIIIVLDPSTKQIVQTIDLVGNTTQTGELSGLPGSMAIDPSTGRIVVEVPYASKAEGSSPSVDVVQFYSAKGNLKSSFGGHSCKEANALCFPIRGMVFIP